MSRGSRASDQQREIVVRGAREHNLKNIDVEIPRDKLVVLTGLSGSGKSSLAFDTIFAEGQRRYVESLSAYARQFLGQMEKPDVDHIDGLSPAISIDQKGVSRNPRSTVGTVTEIYDYLRLLFARVGIPHCPICGRPITAQSVAQMVDTLAALPEGTRLMILAPVIRDRKGEHQARLRGRPQGRLRPRARRRHGLRRGRGAGAGQVQEAHDRGRRRPPGRPRDADADGHTDRVRRLAGDRAQAGRRASSWCNVVDRERTTCSSASSSPARCTDISPGRDRAAQLLLQLAARRLPRLHRARHDAGVRPRAGRPQPGPLDRGRGASPPGCVHAASGYLTPGSWRRSAKHYGFSLNDAGARRWPRTQLRRAPLRHGRRAHPGPLPVASEAGPRRYEYRTVFEGVIPNLQRRYRRPSRLRSGRSSSATWSDRPCPTCNGARLKPESLAVTVGRAEHRRGHPPARSEAGGRTSSTTLEAER